MKEFNINVHVQIGVTDALCSLLSAFVKTANVPQPAPAPAPVPEIKPVAAAPAQADPAPEVSNQPASEAKVEAAPEPAPAQEPEEKELTEVDVRAAMDRTRRRIEGENYKEDTSSEGYKKWHRVLTGWFKTTAAVYGAEKPSTLPDHNARKGFIAECDELHVVNGELRGGDCPF